MSNKPISLFDPAIMRQAAIAAFAKMNPLKLWRNPVMFATELAALYVLVLFVRDLATGGEGAAFAGQIAFWLALTVWFATFAEGVAEGRGKAQAASLRRARSGALPGPYGGTECSSRHWLFQGHWPRSCLLQRSRKRANRMSFSSNSCRQRHAPFQR